MAMSVKKVKYLFGKLLKAVESTEDALQVIHNIHTYPLSPRHHFVHYSPIPQ